VNNLKILPKILQAQRFMTKRCSSTSRQRRLQRSNAKSFRALVGNLFGLSQW